MPRRLRMRRALLSFAHPPGCTLCRRISSVGSAPAGTPLRGCVPRAGNPVVILVPRMTHRLPALMPAASVDPAIAGCSRPDLPSAKMGINVRSATPDAGRALGPPAETFFGRYDKFIQPPPHPPKLSRGITPERGRDVRKEFVGAQAGGVIEDGGGDDEFVDLRVLEKRF